MESTIGFREETLAAFWRVIRIRPISFGWTGFGIQFSSKIPTKRPSFSVSDEIMLRTAAVWLLIALSAANNATAQTPQVSKLWRPGQNDEPGKYVCVAFSPDGTAYAAAKQIAGQNNVVLIRDVITHAQLQRFQIAHPIRVQAISFTPDNESIVCVGPGGISRWNVRTGKNQSEISIDAIADARSIVISPDSSAFAADNKIFDTGTGEMRFQLDAALSAPAFSPDGYQLAVVVATEDKPNISVFDATTGKKSHSIDNTGYTFGDCGMTYTADRKGIIAVTDFRRLVRYDARFGEWIWNGENVPRESALLASTPDGTKLISAAKNSVQIWDTENAKLTGGVAARGELVGLAVTDNSIACVSDDGSLFIWDMTGLQTETQLTRQQIKQEIARVKGDQQAAISWLKDHRVKVQTESDEVVYVGLFSTYYSRSKVTDEWLGILVNFPQLEQLNLHNAHITANGVKQLAPLSNLQDLTLSGTKVTDLGIHKLAPLKSLQSLDLERTHVTDAAMKMLAKHQSLQELDLGFTHVTDAGLKELATLDNLRELTLSGNKITDEGLKHLARLKSLEGLWLWRTAVTDEGMKHVAQIKQLKSFSLGGSQITNVGLKQIAKCKNLRFLGASGLQITFDVEELAQLKNLTYLDLQGTGISDQGLQHIGQLRILTRLNLINTPITDNGLEWLSELKNLKNLFLRGSKVTDEGVQRLKRALPNCNVDRRWLG